MALTIDEKKAIIAYRIQKSAQTMIEARDNASLKHWSLPCFEPTECLLQKMADLIILK
jgi:hypothetical protein